MSRSHRAKRVATQPPVTNDHHQTDANAWRSAGRMDTPQISRRARRSPPSVSPPRNAQPTGRRRLSTVEAPCLFHRPLPSPAPTKAPCPSRASETSPSSPTSTTARPRWSTPCSARPPDLSPILGGTPNHSDDGAAPTGTGTGTGNDTAKAATQPAAESRRPHDLPRPWWVLDPPTFDTRPLILRE